MRPVLVGPVLLGLLCFAHCDFDYNYVECNQASDCQQPGMSCTSDHLCVAGTPNEQLCPQSEIYPQDAPPDAVPIGALFFLPALPSENLRLQAIKLGVNEINSLSGAGVRHLVLHVCNTAQDPNDPGRLQVDNLKAMNVLWNDRQVVAVIGPSRSSDVIDVAAQAAAQRVPLVSATATSPSISNLPQRGYVFRTIPSDSAEAEKLAGLVPGDQKLGLIWVTDAFGIGYQGAFLSAWIDPVKNNMPFISASFASGDLKDLAKKAQTIIDSDPDNVVAIAGVDSNNLVEHLASLSASTSIYLTSSARGTDLLDAAQKLPPSFVGRLQGVAPSVPRGSPEFTVFRASYQAQFLMDPADNIDSTYTYDAFYAIAIAIGSLQEGPTGAAVAQALQRITLDAPGDAISVGQPSYLLATSTLRAGKLKLNGSSGPLGFDRHGDREGSMFEKWGINTTTTPPTYISMPL